MIFAHLPAGYLIARGWRALVPAASNNPRLAAWGMAGGVIPDIDMIWAIFVDHGMVHHHRYPTHWPSFWLGTMAVVALVLIVRRSVAGWHALAVFGLAVASHLFLDWLASAMWLLAPFFDYHSQLVTVPARYRPWWLNFIFHWVGLLDLGIAAVGATVALRERSRVIPHAAAIAWPFPASSPAIRSAAAGKSSAATGFEK